MLPNLRRQTNWFPNIFNEFFSDDWAPMRSMSTIPAINVKEDDKVFTIELAVPGMNKDDFKVHVNDKEQLIIAVEKKTKKKISPLNSIVANSTILDSSKLCFFLRMWIRRKSQPRLVVVCCASRFQKWLHFPINNHHA